MPDPTPTGRSNPQRRRLAALVLTVAVALGAIVVWTTTGTDTASRDASEPASPSPGAGADPPARQAGSRAALGAIPPEGLALGITEPNPALVWSPTARPDVPAAFGRWRAALGGTKPAVYRLMVSWRALQPDRGEAPDLDAAQPGCLRDRAPCAPWAGVREQLAALASRQRDGGWHAAVVLYDTPDWAAEAASACDAPASEPRSRAPRRDALPQYEALVRALLAAAEQEGATLRYWSAWNEPNHPYFLARQRERCDGGPSGAPASASVYLALVAALDRALAQVPGTERILGELAAIRSSDGDGTDVERFVAALPRDVVCESRVFAQHAYAGGRDPVPALARALARHACPVAQRIWITETGAGRPSARLSAGASATDRRRACRDLHGALTRWWQHPRVDVALQYTWREDDSFRVGLVRTDLGGAWPTLRAWRAWSRRPHPGAPPPPDPC